MKMEWLNYVSYFFGGVFIANAVPHAVSGLLGRAFQSPFAKPPGKGLSSAKVNILWGFFNLLVGYFLICKVGDFDIHNLSQIGVAFLGAFLISLQAASHFGKYHGGDL
jgi:hypothetical protein